MCPSCRIRPVPSFLLPCSQPPLWLCHTGLGWHAQVSNCASDTIPRLTLQSGVVQKEQRMSQLLWNCLLLGDRPEHPSAAFALLISSAASTKPKDVGVSQSTSASFSAESASLACNESVTHRQSSLLQNADKVHPVHKSNWCFYSARASNMLLLHTGGEKYCHMLWSSWLVSFMWLMSEL